MSAEQLEKLKDRMDRYVHQLHGAAARLARPVCLMEVCGTHTVNACRAGIHSLMPNSVRLISGPGCPVCVTPQRYIDLLVQLARRPEVTIATYGDMVRVTGSTGSLELVRSEGADVQVVTSAMEAVEQAATRSDRQVVFAAVGFETSAPATAAAVLAAQQRQLDNFTTLCPHKRVVPAMIALLQSPDVAIDGFLCPGHVSVIIGAEAYRPVVERYGKPCAIAGFEPLQIMEGILHLVQQLAAGEARLQNLYQLAVTPEGNRVAQQLLARVFRVADSPWRMLGLLPDSGLELRQEFRRYDALERFGCRYGEDNEPPGCRCGEVITGKIEPIECPLFANACTPVNPIGPCMVSSEGTCRAWFKYRRHEASWNAAARVRT